ncbi:hypothetical protein CEB3_c32580 [Peptococcaceae bacterium CEB3]|nr:hypothetical protein CEB3_c32580 [Peptococcaceae bacterium CEB3]
MASPPQEVTYHQPEQVLIPFDPALRRKRHLPSCIFCGQTQSMQTFKGKPICLTCLQRILNLFPY